MEDIKITPYHGDPVGVLGVSYNTFVDSQRDDVKFAVHTSPDGEPTIMSKKQFGDWVLGYTGDYLRVYPYITMDYLRKNAQLPIATDDNGDEVILPYLIIPKKVPKGEPDIKIQGTTSSPLSNPFSKEKYIQRFKERRKY